MTGIAAASSTSTSGDGGEAPCEGEKCSRRGVSSSRSANGSKGEDHGKSVIDCSGCGLGALNVPPFSPVWVSSAALNESRSFGSDLRERWVGCVEGEYCFVDEGGDKERGVVEPLKLSAVHRVEGRSSIVSSSGVIVIGLGVVMIERGFRMLKI